MINNAQLKNVLLIAAFVITGMFILQGMKAAQTLRDKARDQDAQTETIIRWKQSYQALAGTRQKWEKSFRKEDSVQDMVGIAKHLELVNYGLETDGDHMILSKVEPVMQANQAIGLIRICLATGSTNGDGFLVAATNYEALMTGIDRLAKRADISIGAITLQGDKTFPLAKLTDFCVMLRNS